MTTITPSWVIQSKLESGVTVYWNVPAQNWTRLPTAATPFESSRLAHEEAREAQFQAMAPVTVELVEHR